MADSPDCLGRVCRCHGLIDLVQRASFVHGNMVRLVTLDGVLWITRRTMTCVTLMLKIRRVHVNNFAAHLAGLRVPADMITDFECLGHGNISPIESRILGRTVEGY